MLPIDGRPILTAAAMREAEEAQGDLAGLMMRAGAGAAEAARRLAAGAEVLVLCGPGNNGGDGYVAATLLREQGHPVRVAAFGEPRSDLAREAAARWPGPVEPLAEAKPAPVLVDALFGTGLSRALDDELLGRLRRLAWGAWLTIAVDLPSGLASDDGALLSDVPAADITLALGALKPAHVLQPAARLCGEVRLLDIGVAAESDVAVLPRLGLSAPGVEDHKFSRGLVAIVAGAMPGAGALAAIAAMRIAGYVLLLGSATDRLPHAIVRRRWSPEAIADTRIGAVVIGPGLGRDEAAHAKLDAAMASDRPLVMDGDALHLLDPARISERSAPTILTPHAGEFAKIFDTDGEGGRIDRARTAARGCGATVVLKGPDTVVAHHDGRARVACRGVGWLASAGTGDVLAGVIGGLLAHGQVPFTAATDGVWLHNEAARLAGPAFIADELAAALPRAIAAYL